MHNSMNRRQALGSMLTATAGLCGCTRPILKGKGGISGSRPNIIFILADDLGYGDLGCYGQRQIKTPHIDSMARQGMRFTDFYAGSTVCAPSRCSLMTGLHMGHAYIRGNRSKKAGGGRMALRPADITVAEVLKDTGYSTGIFGKWGLGNSGTSGVPNRKGFDEWFGYLNQGRAHNYYPDYLWNNQDKFELAGNQNGNKGQYTHDLFTERALDFITRHRQKPFFLFLPYTIPHANNELGRKTGNGMEVPSDAPYSNEAWPQPQKNHAAMITRLDRDVGRIIEHVKQLGLDDNTIIFFTSDNGPHKEGGAKPDFFQSGGPLRGIKRSLHDGGIRVPMIVRWPGRIAAGTTCDQPGAFWDFLPTAAELARAHSPEGIDGISMLPAL
jgi:arylsulfatase A-like enzyme